MASVFCDAHVILMVNYFQKGQPINGTYYASHLRQLRENIKDKRRGRFGKGMLFHRDNATAHMSVIAMAAINDCGFELMQHPPYSPDFAPSHFHLFQNFKQAISRTRF